MGFHGGGWFSFIRYDEERDRPQVSRALLNRVVGYARPYWGRAALMVGLIVLTSLLNLMVPLVVSLSVNVLHEEMGGRTLPLRYSWVSFALLLVAPLVLLNTYVNRNVSWRGRSYQLNASSKLAEGLGESNKLVSDQPG